MNKPKSVEIHRGSSAEYSEISPQLVFGLILITLGLYSLHWIYERNKELAQFDSSAPEPSRGAVLMMVFPFIWFFLITFLKLIFSYTNFVIAIIELIGYLLIVILITKYLFDFCSSFSLVTRSHFSLWFILFLFGIVGVIGISINMYFLGISLLIFFIGVAAMQAELNSFYKRHSIKHEKTNYYY